LSYTNQDLDKYEQLLHERYVTVDGDKIIMDRDRDLKGVRSAFENASTIHAEVTEGEWRPVTTFLGEECAECWETTREFKTSWVWSDGKEAKFNFASRFIVAPVEEKGVIKYKLLACDVRVPEPNAPETK
jgi:hypothetical protein